MYIADFHEDRALVRQPSPFAGGGDSIRLDRADHEKKVGASVNDPKFLDRLAEMLGAAQTDEERAELVTICTRNVVADEELPDADAWAQWIEHSRPYFFFSQAGGDRWWVDRLARERGVPTAELRGPARRDRVPAEGTSQRGS